MNATTRSVYISINWIWTHVAAAVWIVAIIAALLIGISIGHSDSSRAPASDQQVTDGVDDQTPTSYTCSMHPTVRLEDPNAKCPICFMDLIPVQENANASGVETQLTLSDSARAMSKIETTKVARFYPSAESRLYGKLVYDETSVVRLSAYFAGRIDRLFVNYVGVSVQQGDHLAELYSPDLLAAFEELRQAKISVGSAENSSAFLRDTASQTLVAAREKLRLYGMTHHQIERVESGSFESDGLTIYSPIGGVVTHLAAREGDYLDTGDPIATVSDLSRLWLDIEAYESQLPLLRWGMPVTFTVEAYPGESFSGQISFIEPTVDERTRTTAVRVAVDNPNQKLKPGMFATAVVNAKISADGAVLSDELAGKWVSPMHPTIVKDEEGVCDICGMNMVTAESLGVVGDASLSVKPLVIPRSAVLFTGTRSVVYVQVPGQDEPTYEGRVVELGTKAGEYYTVRSGLVEDELVVVNGAFRIDSAMQILAKPSMMNPAGGFASGGHNHGTAGSTAHQNPTNRMIPDAFIQSLQPVYEAYLDAQERLADDDLPGYLQRAKHLNGVVESVETAGLIGESLGEWRRAVSKLQSDASATSMGLARQQFEAISLAVLDLQVQFGNPSEETLYTAFCPMAFDFEGAKWLQRGSEINNPYFGSQMLRCGDILETHDPIEQPDHKDTNSKMDPDTAVGDDQTGHTHE